MAKAKKKEKIRAIAQTAADNVQKLVMDKAIDAPTDPWQSFVSYEVITRARKTFLF